jgi:hypothetical protein
MPRHLAWFALIAALGCRLAAAPIAQDNYQFSDPNVENTFRYARMAVGGGVSKLKALQLKGRSKLDLNGSLVDCAVDIKILFPDYYLRIDATATDAKLAGFAGKTALNAIRAGANLSLPPEHLTSAILKNEQMRLARLLLGAATYVTPTFAMIFRSSGLTGGVVDPRVSAKTMATAEGRGEPNVAEVAGAGGFRARFVVDGISRMPAKLIYPNNPQEETMTFEDRRDVNGIKLPFHITTTAGGRIVDELILEQILVNPEISKSDFKR